MGLVCRFWVSCPLLFLVVTLVFVGIPVAGQTVLDLSMIEPDVTILGSGTSSKIHHVVALDFNDSGVTDLFVYDYAYQDKYGDECIFGFFDFSEHHSEAVIDLAIGNHDFVVVGDPYMNYWLGHSLATGDWNHDGVDDIAFGDPVADRTGEFEGGAVFVFWGGDQWQNDGIIDLAMQVPDVLIYSSDLSEEPQIGFDLLSLDINNDGIDDLAVGAKFGPNQTGNGTGAVYVVYGSDSFTEPVVVDVFLGQQDLTFLGKEGADWFGQSLARGDINGDQKEDLVVGAGKAWRDDSRYGAMYAFYGSEAFPPHHVIDLGMTEADVTVVGSQGYAYFGQYVTCGDFNGDGLDDMCGGQYSYDDKYNGRGAAYVIWGQSDFVSGTTLDLRSELADVSYFGAAMDYYYLGMWASAGDLNNDNIDELCISSAWTSEHEQAGSGGHNVFIGHGGYPPNHVVDLTDFYPSIRTIGDNYGDVNSGSIISSLVDINGDGFRDLLFGHGLADRPEADNCGEIYIFYSDGQPIDRPPRVLAGPGPEAMNPPELRLWDPFYNPGGWVDSFTPFAVEGYGLNPAAGDLDGDGYDEILVGPGPGFDHPPVVMALDEVGELLWQFQAYGSPRYGVNLCVGDLDGDGDEEVVTGAGPGEVYGPHVRGWTLEDVEILPLGNVSFLAYGTHRWGVNVACGDIDGDGMDEIVTGAGPGAVFGPHVRGWDVDGGAAEPIGGVSYLAYGTPRWGVNVGCGDIDGDGIDEIVTGPGPSVQFGSHVRGWDYDGEYLAAMGEVNFFSHPNFSETMGCVVTCGDLDNDHIDEILTGPGPHLNNPAQLKSWNYDGDQVTQIDRMSFLVFEEGSFGAGVKLAFGNLYQAPPFLQ